MAELQLPTGAYIISNKQTRTCLERRGKGEEIRTATEDALHRREHQIWWVEALPEYEGALEGPVYSVQNLPAKLGLDTQGWKEGSNVNAGRISGQPWQMWSIKRVLDDKEGEFYNIISFHNKKVLDIDPDSKPLDSAVRTSDFAADNHRQRWEFVIPMVTIPPGWVQIRNAADGSIIQQTYITSPPFLALESHPSALLNDRRNWGSQWLLLLEENTDSPQRYWSIKNRLTGGFLRCQRVRDKNGKIINVSSTSTWRPGPANPEQIWSFRVQGDGYWIFINKRNSCVLEKADGEDTGLKVASKDSNEGNCRKWEFVQWRKDCEAVKEKPLAYHVL